MDNSLGLEYNLLFLALGWGFAIVTMVLSWVSADHGLRDVNLASRSRDEKRHEVLELVQRGPELTAEYPRVYAECRKQTFNLIEQGNALLELYKHQVQKTSRYSDVGMIFPQISVPPEFASPEPPPLRFDAGGSFNGTEEE